MTSSSRTRARERASVRDEGMIQREQQRIVVQDEGAVTSMLYRGANPATRYLPRATSVWGWIRDAFRMG